MQLCLRQAAVGGDGLVVENVLAGVPVGKGARLSLAGDYSVTVRLRDSPPKAKTTTPAAAAATEGYGSVDSLSSYHL